jgi:hypothetical protein
MLSRNGTWVELKAGQQYIRKILLKKWLKKC